MTRRAVKASSGPPPPGRVADPPGLIGHPAAACAGLMVLTVHAAPQQAADWVARLALAAPATAAPPDPAQRRQSGVLLWLCCLSLKSGALPGRYSSSTHQAAGRRSISATTSAPAAAAAAAAGGAPQLLAVNAGRQAGAGRRGSSCSVGNAMHPQGQKPAPGRLHGTAHYSWHSSAGFPADNSMVRGCIWAQQGLVAEAAAAAWAMPGAYRDGVRPRQAA